MSSDTKTISQLPIATPLTGDELIPVVQNGITKRATINQIQTETLGGQQFITADLESGLPQSRQLTATGGLQFTDNGPLGTFELSTIGLLNSLSSLGASGIIVNNGGVSVARTLTQPAEGIVISNANGVAGNPTFSLANDLAALEGLSSTGFAVRTATDTWAQRSLVPPAAGISITNPDGVAGNPTLVLTNDLAALEGLGSTGFAVRTAANTWVQRSIAGTANEITVTNGDGVSGNPTVSLPAALTFTGKTITGGLFTTGTTLVAPVIFIADDALNISDNIDPSKSFQFQASGITTGTTRILTVPDASDTLAVLGLAQTFTNKTLTSPNINAIVNLTTNGYVKTSGGVGTLSVQTTPIPSADGGTGFASYAVGDILYADTTTTLARLPDAAVGNALISGGVGVAPSWGKISLTTAVSGTLPVVNGGTGAVTLTAHGVLLGEGTSPIVATAAMTDGQLLVGQTGADPLPKTITGGVTITAAGVTTVITNANLTGPVTSVGNATSVTNNAITNTMLAQMPANTIKGNNTGSTDNALDLTSAQVSVMLAAPQVTVLTSGSGTYTTPTGAKYLVVEGVAGGGGAAGGQASYNVAGAAGANGEVTTFGTLSAGAGGGGSVSAVVVTASVATGGDINIPGGTATASVQSTINGRPGNAGANSVYGGAGGGGGDGQPGGVGAAGSGSGGGSGGSSSNLFVPGGGGNAGAFFRKLITTPAATYSYAVGAGGAAGTTAVGGAGGAGGSGLIIVTAFFQ